MIQLVIITTFFLVSFSAAYGKADYAKSYASVLDKYRSFVQAYKAEKLINEDGELAEEFDGDPWAIMSGEMDGVKGYALKDLSGDDIPELLLLSKDDNNLTIQAIFYLAGKEPTLLEEFWSRSQCAIGGDGFLYKVGASGAAEVVYEKCKLKPDGSAFEVLESIQMTSYNAETEELMTDSEGEPVVKYYHTVGDNKPTEITEAEFDKLIEQWPDDNGPAKLEFTGV
jgi:hypothetical protein